MMVIIVMYLFGSSGPILVVPQEIIPIPVVERGREKQSRHSEVAHFVKAPVGRVDASAHNRKFASRDLLA